jgi:putative oxidoreductase
MSPRVKEVVLALVRIVLGVLFAWAAVTKIPNMELFAEETANYRMLPAQLVSLFAVCLAGVEILSSALMVLGVAVRACAGVVGLMLVAFIVALSQALLRGINLTCGCFGGSELASWWTVARDVVMLAACVPLWKAGGGRLFWPQSNKSPLPRSG